VIAVLAVAVLAQATALVLMFLMRRDVGTMVRGHERRRDALIARVVGPQPKGRHLRSVK
jgi:hypothetical protein